MISSSLFDFATGLIASLFGSLVLVVWGIPAILVEAILLRILLPGARAFRDSLVMNVISTVVGLVVGVPIQVLYPLLGDLLSLDYYYGNPTLLSVFWLAFAFITWGMSVLIEGALLRRWLEPDAPAGRLWRAVVIVNAVTYAVPFALLWMFIKM
jgi:hypothetical protein